MDRPPPVIDYFDGTKPAGRPPAQMPGQRLRGAGRTALVLAVAAVVVWSVGLWWSFLTVLVVLSLGPFPRRGGGVDDGDEIGRGGR